MYAFLSLSVFPETLTPLVLSVKQADEKEKQKRKKKKAIRKKKISEPRALNLIPLEAAFL